jgi:hypothetical protein
MGANRPPPGGVECRLGSSIIKTAFPNLVRKLADDETDVTRCPQARNNAVRRNAGVNKGEQALYPDYLQVTVGTGSV